jgi:hypothetical protein
LTFQNSAAVPYVVKANVSFTSKATVWHQVVDVHVTVDDIDIFWTAYGNPADALSTILKPALNHVYRHMYADMPSAAPVEQHAIAAERTIVQILQATFGVYKEVSVSTSDLLFANASTSAIPSVATVPPYAFVGPQNVVKVVAAHVYPAQSPSSCDENYHETMQAPLALQQIKTRHQLDLAEQTLRHNLRLAAEDNEIELASKRAAASNVAHVQRIKEESDLIYTRGIDAHVALEGTRHTVSGVTEGSVYVH